MSHVAGAYFAAGALSGGVVLADELADLVAAYHSEFAAINALPHDVPADYPQPVFDRLTVGGLPAAGSRDSALSALRLARDQNDDDFGSPMVSNLIDAVVRYLEASA